MAKMTAENSKTCTACEEQKLLEEFRDGQGRCRPCLAEADRKRRAKKTGKGEDSEKDSKGVTGKVRLEVMLKAVTVREKKVSIGWEGQRQELTLDTADHVFINSRLEVKLEVAEDQRDLFEGVNDPRTGQPIRTLPKLKAVADSARISVGISTITGTLTFNRKDVDASLDDLLLFAGKQGYLHAKRTGFAGGDAPPNAEEDDAGEVVAKAGDTGEDE